MLPLVLAIIATVLYLAGALAIAQPLLNRPALVSRSVGLALAGGGVAAHAAAELLRHGGGIDLHFFTALSVVVLLVAALTLAVNIARPVAGLGVIVFPLAASLVTLDILVQPSSQPLSLGWQIQLHVAVALLAYAVLSLAAVLAILLLGQERALRNHRLSGGLVRVLPPLTLTEALMFRLVGAGFALLTLTLLSGVLFVENLFAQHLVHKTVLSLVAWVVFGVLLFGRWRFGWRGRRAVRLVLTGMGVLLLGFFGSKFVLELVLQRAN
ncbi:cytochrome C assembly family protein [Tahibacter amnicola]|uniref:Cytochrome c biogenesis protein CcsA n=1 Tax=Tahibacter amnicola TaxID=2976241 RepID=A0ABY6BIB1_9GAMM|nr:cytochrome c biogenesis protein CcsA [Tahibacter amnicola]UXI69599.1 cytochrome c biogenesis protein CcsA [Tahibacter amnicola]